MRDPLPQYDPPAQIDDFPADRPKREQLRRNWDAFLSGAISASASENFYDPKEISVGAARRAKVEWSAFPKPIEDRAVSLAVKLRLADFRQPDDQAQVEYCEWCVERNPLSRKIIRVTFTTEVSKYYEELWTVAPQRVLALYRQHVNAGVQLADLGFPGPYDPLNRWNTGNEYLPGSGGSMHMIVGINTLEAAVGVVAGAADSPPELPTRGPFHADALIALTVGRVVGRGNLRISFTNPVGVYLQEPEFNRFELPAGAPPALQPRDCWRVVRGRRDRGLALRAVFQVPARFGFTVGDIKIDGRPIEHGSQIARTIKSGTYVTPIARA